MQVNPVYVHRQTVARDVAAAARPPTTDQRRAIRADHVRAHEMSIDLLERLSEGLTA